MDANTEVQGSNLTPEMEGLNLPPEIQLLEKLGTGSFCTVYKCQYQGEMVALKAYTAAAEDWYRRNLDKNIAVYEMLQNREFRKNPELVPYTAKPIRVIGQDGKHSLCFVQEFVDGITLEELTAKVGRVPVYLIKTGEIIANTCDDKGLKGIDQFMQNILLRESAGTYVPVLHDFKHIPRDKEKKAGTSLLARLGMGRKDAANKGFLRDWNALDRALEKKSA